ncbi:carbohydrate ABC transporter permease [Paenibacillus flagellatus]|nr:sugar ABC transporter permease [Paenibacillus flagellatus]
MNARNFRDQLQQFAFVLPALAVYIVFFIYPSVGSIYYSFTDWHGLEKNIAFVGWDNYARIVQDEAFATALSNTLRLVVVVSIVQNVAALALAIGLNGSIRTKKLLRTMFFMPAVISALSVGFVWSYIYNPVDGILNAALRAVGLSAWENDWLGNADIVLYSIMGIIVWQNVGYAMVIYLAGLQGISDSYYEAAAIEGAGPWQRFRAITLPLIGPATTVNVMLSVIGCLKMFDIIYATTGGGPGYATETIASLLFSNAFGGRNEYGYGAAIAIVLYVLIFVVSWIMLKFFRSREVEA